MDASGQALFIALTQKVDLRHNSARRLGVLALSADRGEQPALADTDLGLAANLPGQGNRGVLVISAFLQPLEVERDGRT